VQNPLVSASSLNEDSDHYYVKGSRTVRQSNLFDRQGQTAQGRCSRQTQRARPAAHTLATRFKLLVAGPELEILHRSKYDIKSRELLMIPAYPSSIVV